MDSASILISLRITKPWRNTSFWVLFTLCSACNTRSYLAWNDQAVPNQPRRNQKHWAQPTKDRTCLHHSSSTEDHQRTRNCLPIRPQSPIGLPSAPTGSKFRDSGQNQQHLAAGTDHNQPILAWRLAEFLPWAGATVVRFARLRAGPLHNFHDPRMTYYRHIQQEKSGANSCLFVASGVQKQGCIAFSHRKHRTR